MTCASKEGMFSRRIDSAIRFFLYVLIFWLPYGPAVIETCVIISFLLWLVKRAVIQREVWRGKEQSFRYKLVRYLKGFKVASSDLNGLVAFFLGVCVLSTISSVFFENAAHNFLTKTLEWFIVYFLVIEVFREKRHISIALGIWLFTAFSTVIDSFIQFYITHKDIFLGHMIVPGARATAGFKTPNGLGGYLSLLIPFLFASLFLDHKAGRYRLLGLLGLFLSLWSLIITSSRGAIFGTGVGILFLFFTWAQGQKKVKSFVIPISLAVLAILSICIFDLLWMFRSETVNWRLAIWRGSLKMIADRPILGHGINSYMMIFEAYRQERWSNPTYAHNCYLQLAVEIGIAGLLGFLWIIGKFYAQFFKVLQGGMRGNKNFIVVLAGLYAGILSFLVHSFFDTNFYSLQLSVYLWVMIGITVSFKKVLTGSLHT